MGAGWADRQGSRLIPRVYGAVEELAGGADHARPASGPDLYLKPAAWVLDGEAGLARGDRRQVVAGRVPPEQRGRDADRAEHADRLVHADRDERAGADHPAVTG